MEWDDSIQGMRLHYPYNDTALKDISAIYNDTREYPMGFKVWKVTNDNCPGPPTKNLVFSGCDLNEFTCNNGNCIKITKRCDNIIDCPDSSDESNCDRFNSSTYNKHIPPESPNTRERFTIHN